jgi:hypothetical protein
LPYPAADEFHLEAVAFPGLQQNIPVQQGADGAAAALADVGHFHLF